MKSLHIAGWYWQYDTSITCVNPLVNDDDTYSKTKDTSTSNRDP